MFVSSALGELAEERRAVSRAISALRLTPVMFEQGARPHPPRDVYRAYLAQSEVFVGLYWQRYGQTLPGGDVSGLEEEFDLSARLPKLLYIKEPAPAATRGLPGCWTGSGSRGRSPIAPSAGPLSWAGSCAMTWRRC